jgi:hypothetical protein
VGALMVMDFAGNFAEAVYSSFSPPGILPQCHH